MRGAALLAALVICSSPLAAQDFEAAFGGRYRAAVELVRERGMAWSEQCSRLGADPGALIPVVFPELLRFSLLRSEVEALGIATLYVAEGTAAADFSLGRFQMKPSFVETLEAGLRRDGTAPAGLRAILDFPPAATPRDRRAVRFQRLMSEEWQVVYLAGFYRLVHERFDLRVCSTVERIRFLSAAYNHGYWHSREEIEKAEAYRLFPNGSRPGRPAPYRYTDVAVDFYRRYWRAMTGDRPEEGSRTGTAPPATALDPGPAGSQSR